MNRRILFWMSLVTFIVISSGCSRLTDLGFISKSPDTAKITPPSGSPFLTLTAKGEEVFRCTVDSKGGYWRAERPNATLYDSKGNKVGTLSGPMSAFDCQDGSRIISSQLIAWADPENPKTTMKYALFKAFSDPGDGLFNDVRYIQRINPHGGMPSLEQQSKCTTATRGRLLKIPFSADFVFWK